MNVRTCHSVNYVEREQPACLGNISQEKKGNRSIRTLRLLQPSVFRGYN